VTGLRLAGLSMRHRGNLDPKLLESHMDAQYVMGYLFSEVFALQPPEIRQYLLSTAILDRFNGSLCETVCTPIENASTRTLGGWDFIAWLKEENMFIIPLDAEGRWFRYHHLFKKLLGNQLERRLSSGDINALHAQASTWFSEYGLIEEALKHALAGENIAAAARLIAKHGFDLLEDEQWPRLERWLKMLPSDTVDRDPELLVHSSWLHFIYSQFTKLASSLEKAEALSVQTITESTKPHLDALRSAQQYIGANGERALALAWQAHEKIPRNHRWALLFSYIIQAVAHQMLGDSSKAHSTFEEAMRDLDLGGGTFQGYFQATPCFIYWIDADLTSLLQTAAHSMKLGKQTRASSAIVHSLYFLGIAHYLRNELSAAEENLRLAAKDPYSQHALNFAHSAFALALTHQARSREDEANQVGEAVVSYALEAKNPDVLRIARAFQAELALRQRRLGEASRWTEQYQAQPFSATYRFYVPQLTAVKILLAQDTTTYRRQAADLLDQLHEFFVSIHSVRFQIDSLALKALLFDSRKDKSAALKALKGSLTLAEPGGFIRPFVDLGPRMADLLKRLLNQNIAVDYIKKLLVAFEEEDKTVVVPEVADHPIASAHRSLRPSTPSQPLLDPLTNREVDVLELLAQRLSDKEIAEKLFISTTTVKGHLQNLYGKLNVGKRRDAVEKAEALGILSRH